MRYRKLSRNQKLYSFLLILCVIGFWIFENFYTPNTYKSSGELDSGYEIPEFLLPAASNGQWVKHDFFMFSYREEHEQAEWLAYKLLRKDLTYDDRERPYFVEDPLVRTKSADWRNYRGSGYDRGHLCPAGDRRFSEEAYNQTFYTSNISPQDPDFNAGVWNRLEQQVRRWCKRYGDLYVFTAGILEAKLPEIGDEGVSVPAYFYKIVARGNPEHLEVIAFLMPHKDSNEDLKHFVVSIDRIEALSGIDFFKQLPDPVENKIESNPNSNRWKF